MGAWSPAIFDNDTVMDWVSCVLDANAFALRAANLIDPLARVVSRCLTPKSGHLDIEEALGAMEIVAFLADHPSKELPDTVRWSQSVNKWARKTVKTKSGAMIEMERDGGGDLDLDQTFLPLYYFSSDQLRSLISLALQALDVAHDYYSVVDNVYDWRDPADRMKWKKNLQDLELRLLQAKMDLASSR
jgi:hypothetical protein